MLTVTVLVCTSLYVVVKLGKILSWCRFSGIGWLYLVARELVSVVVVPREDEKSAIGILMVAVRDTPTAKELSPVVEKYSVNNLKCIAVVAWITLYSPASGVRISHLVGQWHCPRSSVHGAINHTSTLRAGNVFIISRDCYWFFVQTESGRSIRVLENGMSKILKFEKF